MYVSDVFMYVCMQDRIWSLLLSGVPLLRPSPPALTPPFTALGSQQKRSALFLLLRTFAVFVCQLVCVFKYSLFYVFDLMMTATLRIYKKIQLSCIFGYCFIAVGRERSAPKRKQPSTRGTQSKKKLPLNIHYALFDMNSF